MLQEIKTIIVRYIHGYIVRILGVTWGSLNVDTGAVASGSPGDLLEIQTFKPT